MHYFIALSTKTTNKKRIIYWKNKQEAYIYSIVVDIYKVLTIWIDFFGSILGFKFTTWPKYLVPTFRELNRQDSSRLIESNSMTQIDAISLVLI